MRNIHVLMIDNQNDFCDPKGSLFVPGADASAVRATALINRIGSKVTMFHATLDSHQETHIAHPLAWVDHKGNHPTPFTLITKADVVSKVWRAHNSNRQAWFEKYVDSLEKNGRYVLCIWPPHCIIGSWGHSLVPTVSDALRHWSRSKGRWVNYVTKGSNDDTEHYSAVISDVPIDSDTTTKLNTRLIDAASKADEIPILGQALSHCVRNTITDIANNFGTDQVKKFILITDCVDNVPGFESLGEAFVKDMVKRGMRTTTSAEYLK